MLLSKAQLSVPSIVGNIHLRTYVKAILCASHTSFANVLLSFKKHYVL